MNAIDQGTAIAEERAVYWRHPHFRDMGLLKARFRRHRYELHTRPTYVIALITGGCERVRIGRRREDAVANTVLVVNPEECHDGLAGCDDGWAYRTFYPPVALLAEVARPRPARATTVSAIRHHRPRPGRRAVACASQR